MLVYGMIYIYIYLADPVNRVVLVVLYRHGSEVGCTLLIDHAQILCEKM